MSKPRSLLSSINQVNAIEKQIIENGGEITEEMNQALVSAGFNIKQKIDGYAFVIEALGERGKYWNEKAALFKKYSKTCLAVVERLRGTLKYHMIEKDTKEIFGKEIRFKLQNANWALEVNEAEIPPEYFKEEIVRTVDKEKIREAIQAGQEVPGAKKVESYSLRVYPNHHAKLQRKNKRPPKTTVGGQSKEKQNEISA